MAKNKNRKQNKNTDSKSKINATEKQKNNQESKQAEVNVKKQHKEAETEQVEVDLDAAIEFEDITGEEKTSENETTKEADKQAVEPATDEASKEEISELAEVIMEEQEGQETKYTEDQIRARVKKLTRKKRTKRIIRRMVFSLIYLVIFGAIGIFVAYNSVYGNYKKTAETILSDYKGGNWAQLYNYLILEESEYVDITTFVNSMNAKFVDADLANIKEKEVKEEENVIYITYEYTSGEDKIKKTESIKLVRTDEKRFKFFDVWKVDITSDVVHDVVVRAHYRYDITFDGKKLERDENNKIDKKGYVSYVIPRAFVGSHIIQCKRIGLAPVVAYVEFNEDGARYRMPAKEMVIEEYLATTSRDIVFGLYQAALSDGKIKTYKDYCTSGGYKKLKKTFESLKNAINKEDGAYLESMDVSDYDIYLSDEELDGKIDVIVDFKCDFVARAARSNISGVRKEYEGSATSQAKIRFKVNDDGTYIVTGLNVECFDYSEKVEEETE